MISRVARSGGWRRIAATAAYLLVPTLLLCCTLLSARRTGAQPKPSQPAVRQPTARGHAVTADVTMRLYVPSGRVRLSAWDRDSIHLRGTVSSSSTQFGGGSRTHMKFGVESRVAGDSTLPNADWEVFVPRSARVWVKMIDGQLEAAGVTGELELYAVRGSIAVRDVGGVTSIESIDAPVSVLRSRGDLRVRGSRGAVTLDGVAGTASVATVSGPVSLKSFTAEGRVETIGGTIAVNGGSLDGSTLELQTHAGAIDLTLDAARSPLLDLSTRAGPVQGPRLTGSAEYGQLSARSFKGRITVRAVSIVP